MTVNGQVVRWVTENVPVGMEFTYKDVELEDKSREYPDVDASSALQELYRSGQLAITPAQHSDSTNEIPIIIKGRWHRTEVLDPKQIRNRLCPDPSDKRARDRVVRVMGYGPLSHAAKAKINAIRKGKPAYAARHAPSSKPYVGRSNASTEHHEAPAVRQPASIPSKPTPATAVEVEQKFKTGDMVTVRTAKGNIVAGRILGELADIL